LIKINLIAGERKVVKKSFAFGRGQQVTGACAGIMLLAVAGIGLRYWSITRESKQIDADLEAAQKETTRLHSVIAQVQQFEQRKTQLQQRVTLIEELRSAQAGPVHMLDQISLALPSSLWLSEVKQTATAGEVLIDGKSLSLTGLSDFVVNLEHSGYFQRSIEIMSSVTETNPQQGETIKFQIKAVFKNPAEAATAEAATKTAEAKDQAEQLKQKS
jgi:type IV pilus assembly protein PilN